MATWSDRALYLLGVAGLTASIAALFLGMRAVMDIGGFCAEGGPYEIETHCPEGVPVLMTLAFPGLFGFGGLVAWRGSRIGGNHGIAVALAWPALFLSLGWNFLEYGINPPGGGGLALGWLICAVVFIAMGGVPLLIGLQGARLRRPVDRSVIGWWAAIGLAVAAGIALGYVVFRFFTG